MAEDWKLLFDNYGIKTVSATDKSKAAYLPNTDQRIAIKAAGIKPSRRRPAPGFQVEVLFESKPRSVEASYYSAQRSSDPDRGVEPRMGHEMISSWMNVGDSVIIGNIGARLFVAKASKARKADTASIQALASGADPATILKKALKAKGVPKRRQSFRNDFVRNLYVVAAAMMRAGGICDVPGCQSKPFATEAGSTYLEVHHVVPLGEGGDDALANAAAICPRCHRELHFGRDRLALRARLAANVLALYDPVTGDRRRP